MIFLVKKFSTSIFIQINFSTVKENTLKISTEFLSVFPVTLQLFFYKLQFYILYFVENCSIIFIETYKRTTTLGGQLWSM
jgi:hypothetical protein